MTEEALLIALEGAPHEAKRRVIHAIDFVKIHHEGQFRKSGEPYIIHLFAVALALWTKFHDVPLTIGGLLHDAVEDCTDVTIEQIHTEFGEDVGFLVDAATKDEHSFYLYPDVYFEDKIERQLWAGMKDVRALLIKLADREHNISTLEHLKAAKQIRMAFETQAIYEPLKKIVGYAEVMGIAESTTRFIQWLEERNISTPREYKEHLFQQSFQTFGSHLYQLVYQHTDNVLWEIEDLSLYSQLVHNKDFEESTIIHELWSNKDAFKVVFSFRKGFLASNQHIPLKISSFIK